MKTKKKESKLSRIEVLCKCGKLIMLDLNKTSFGSSVQECELCGDHGSVELRFHCDKCGTSDSIELSSW